MSESTSDQSTDQGPRFRGVIPLLFIVVLGVVGVRSYLGPNTVSAPHEAVKTTEPPAPPVTAAPKSTRPSTVDVFRNRSFKLKNRSGGGDPPPPKPQDPTPDKATTSDDPLRAVLPYLSEGGVAMLGGVALGALTRTVLKIILFTGLLIGGVGWYFSEQGIIAVDWMALGTWLKQAVVHLPRESTALAWVQSKVPSAGALGAGYFIGLRKFG